MEVKIEIKHVNGLANPKVKIEEGRVDYTLPFEVQLPPGDFDRIVNLFRQRIPVQLTISSPQAKMDLFTEAITDMPVASWTIDELADMRKQAKDALKTSEIAERLAVDSGDREVANAAATTAAEAISKLAVACGVTENALLTVLSEEVRQEILDEDTIEEAAAEEAAIVAESSQSPEELHQEIDAHAAEGVVKKGSHEAKQTA